MSPAAPALTPSWLSVDSVKEWLRVNAQDTGDDDLLNACAAMTEPYVQRCRPEWWQGQTPPVAPAVFTVTPSTESAPTIIGALRSGRLSIPYARLEPLGTEYALPDDSPVTVALFDADQSPIVAVAYRRYMTTGAVEALVQGTLREWLADEAPVRMDWTGVSGDPVVFTPLLNGIYRPDSETYQGAVMYAAREYRRRNSPAGIELFGDVTSFVTRYDSDIERALQTGQYARPVIA